MTSIFKQDPSKSQFGISHKSSYFLPLLISLLIGALFSVIWPQSKGFSGLAVWLLGISVGFLITSWLFLRSQNLAAWGVAVIGQLSGVAGLFLMLIDSLKI